MEIYTPAKRDFLAKFPRYEPVIRDSTSVTQFKFCPRSYFYRIVLGFVPKGTADESPFFPWGSAYHKYREVLEVKYKELYNGIPLTPSGLMDCHVEAANAGMAVWKSQGKDQPLGSKWEFMTSARLLKSFTVVFQWWMKEKTIGSIEVISTEQPFNIALGPKRDWRTNEVIEGEYNYSGGRFDQIVRWKGNLWGRDFKTTSREGDFYARSLFPNDQFTRYTIAEGTLQGEQIAGQIIEVLYNSKKEGPRITPYTVNYTTWQIEQWKRDELEFWGPVIDRARDLDLYPMNEKSCTYCKYHSVCTSKSEEGMASQLQSKYDVSPWNFSKVGEDAD